MGWKWFHKIRWQRKRKIWRKQWEEKDGDYASSSGASEDKEQAKKRVPFWRKDVGKEVMDTEKGVANRKSVSWRTNKKAPPFLLRRPPPYNSG